MIDVLSHADPSPGLIGCDRFAVCWSDLAATDGPCYIMVLCRKMQI